MESPPPLVVFSSLENYLRALDAATLESCESEIRHLHDAGLPPVVSIRGLSVLFGYRPQFVGAMCKNLRRYYRTFSIPKGRNRRQIEAPKVALKVIQKWIGHYLSRAIRLPDCVVGFVPKRSTLDGASKHCRAKWVFSTDVTDFFHSTSIDLVVQSLERIGYLHEGAHLIAHLSCLDGGLTQGSPASPVLSNLAFAPLDEELQEFCERLGLSYSRYADDIAISGKEDVPPNLQASIRDRIEARNWKIAEDKTQLIHSPNRMKVYGLLVNGDRPRLSKGYRRRIRVIRHLIEHNRIPDESFAEAQGHLAYARCVENYKMPDIQSQ